MSSRAKAGRLTLKIHAVAKLCKKNIRIKLTPYLTFRPDNFTLVQNPEYHGKIKVRH
jgi:hypothetical protein